MLLLAGMCAKFGGRPSEIYGIRDQGLAVDFDCAAALKLTLAENPPLTLADPSDSFSPHEYEVYIPGQGKVGEEGKVVDESR